MRTKLMVWVWIVAMASGSLAQPEDREENLRRAAKLPQMSFQFGLTFSQRYGFTMSGIGSDGSAEIAALQQAMRGDASDAERSYRLGELYRQEKKEDQAKEAFARAVALYRQQVQAQPHDGRLLTQFAQALDAAGEEEEAETMLRRAVEVAPREWQGWAALGDFLGGRSLEALLGGKAALGGEANDQLFAQLLQTPPTPEQSAEAQQLLAEAGHCYDQAVALAPQEPQLYGARGAFHVLRGLVQGLASAVRGEQANPWAAMFAPEALADLQQAARLSPQDVQAVASAALFEVVSLAVQNGQPLEFGDGGLWNALPDQTKQSVQEAMGQLEQLAQGEDEAAAARAAEALGMLQTLAGDLAKAETSLRRAVTLDPTREQAWELRTFLMIADERYEDLISLCEERLKHKDSVRNRLLLAKVYEKLNQLDPAEEHVQAALKLEPEDFTANLALAALRLKRSDEAAALAQVGERLAQLEVQAAAASPQQRSDYFATRGLYLALTGHLEEARQQLEQALEQDPGHEVANAALKALGPEG